MKKTVWIIIAIVILLGLLGEEKSGRAASLIQLMPLCHHLKRSFGS